MSTPFGRLVRAWRLARAALAPVTDWARSARRSHSYPIAGVLLAAAALSGLPFARAADAGRLPSPAWVAKDVLAAPFTYGWAAASLVVAALGLGLLLGRWFDRTRTQAITDPLTGLFNRRYFAARLAAELARSRRDQRPVCVLCIDVDHLKAINDGRGHQAGDEALLSVAGSLASGVRPADVVARLGGDEFAVLLPATPAAEAQRLAQRLVALVIRQSEASTGHVGISVGVCLARPESDAETLLADADVALYRAKASGGGRSELWRLEARSTGESLRVELVAHRQSPDERGEALTGNVLRTKISPAPGALKAAGMRGGSIATGRLPFRRTRQGCIRCARRLHGRQGRPGSEPSLCRACRAREARRPAEHELGGEG